MNNRSAWMAGGIFLLLVLLACGIGWWLISGPDPRIARIRQLQSELAAMSDAVDENVRREKFVALRTEMESLPASQRNELRESIGNVFRQRMTEQMHRFNQLPPSERIAFLDAQIDRMEKRGSGGGTGRPGGPPPGAGGTQRGSGGPPGGGFGEGAPRGNRSEEQREARRRSRLDGTSPEQRAEFALFIEAMRERRKARGLPDRGPRGF